MKKILFMVVAMMLTLGLFAQEKMTAEQIDAEDAFDYMKKNGIEYEVMLDKAVKVLPKGARMLTIEHVQGFKDDFEEAINSKTFYTVQSWAYPMLENGEDRMLVLAGGHYFTCDGYLYKWERNTSDSQSSPGWTKATQAYACPGGSTSSTLVSYCDQTNPNISVIAYPTDYLSGESGYSADYNECTACSKCFNNHVVSFRFSVRTYVVDYVQQYIIGIGWVWFPIKIFNNWVSTLSSGTESFVPVWDLCDTGLTTYCTMMGWGD